MIVNLFFRWRLDASWMVFRWLLVSRGVGHFSSCYWNNLFHLSLVFKRVLFSGSLGLVIWHDEL